MATTTTYSTKISTPVLVGWKCEICGVRNANIGEIRFTSEASTSSIRSSKHAKAQEEAENYAKTHWFENAYSIISDPNANGERMYESLFLDKPRCENCLKKPRWYDPKTYLPFVPIAVVVAIISVCWNFGGIPWLGDFCGQCWFYCMVALQEEWIFKNDERTTKGIYTGVWITRQRI